MLADSFENMFAHGFAPAKTHETFHYKILPSLFGMTDCEHEIIKLLNLVKTSRAFTKMFVSDTSRCSQSIVKNSPPSYSLPPPSKFRRKRQSFPEARLQPTARTALEPLQIDQNQYQPSIVAASDDDNGLLMLMKTVKTP